MSSFSFRNSLTSTVSHPCWPLLIYAAAWTTILTVTVAVASFTAEVAFVSFIGRSSADSVTLPLDIPTEKLCFPARLVKRSRVDMVVPPVFAAVVVVGSACLVKAFGLLEADEPL